jgi:hypothetical protein
MGESLNNSHQPEEKETIVADEEETKTFLASEGDADLPLLKQHQLKTVDKQEECD